MRSLSVLLVDDEPAIRRALEKALTRMGHRALLAASGEEACELLAAFPVDVVVMDLRMPSMSGQTLYHSIASRWPHLATRVVVMTGDPLAEDHNEWLELHDLPVLMKPFELAQLEALLRAITAGERWRNQG
jgi:two-component system response regulator MprA